MLVISRVFHSVYNAVSNSLPKGTPVFKPGKRTTGATVINLQAVRLTVSQVQEKVAESKLSCGISAFVVLSWSN